MVCCSVIISLIILFFILIFIRKKEPEAILGIYKQNGKWYYLKYVIFLLILYFRRLKQKIQRDDKTNGETYQKNVVNIHTMDMAQPLSEHTKGFDAVFFIGTNLKGYTFALGMERRHKGLIHGVLYFIIPQKGMFRLPCVPDTCLFSTENGEDGNSFEANGIKVEPIKAMHKWKLSYNGNMKHENDLYSINFEGEWYSSNKHFVFETDCNASTLAEAIAREEWTQEYFDNLKDAHQTHYEQMGFFKGNITIDNEFHSLDLQAFRDHSYGYKRDWDLMYRYAFFILFFKDGSSCSLGIICQPCTSTKLKIGYRCTPKGKNIPISWCDFELYQHGENGIAPKDHAFQFKAGKKLYTLQINVEHESIHYVGSNWEAKMVERFVNCTINGIPGYGVSEFHYHNNTGRPEEISKQDPQWFQNHMENIKIMKNKLI